MNFPSGRIQAIADEVENETRDDEFRFWRGAVIALLLTALVAGCVEMIL